MQGYRQGERERERDRVDKGSMIATHPALDNYSTMHFMLLDTVLKERDREREGGLIKKA